MEPFMEGPRRPSPPARASSGIRYQAIPYRHLIGLESADRPPQGYQPGGHLANRQPRMETMEGFSGAVHGELHGGHR